LQLGQIVTIIISSKQTASSIFAYYVN